VLAAHERVALCCTGASPLPLSDSVTDEFPALLANASVPLAVPVTCGWNVTVYDADCPADSVMGSVIPLTTNSVLVIVPDEIVTDDPLALNIPFNDALVPVVILPKFSAVGDTVNCPAVAPVPDSPIFSCEFEAFDRIASVPEIVPDVLGENTTPNVRLCPPASVVGRVNPFTAKDPLDILAPDTVMLALPVLLSVSINVCELPGRMLPKLRLVDEAAIWPAAGMPAPESVAVAEVIVLLVFHFFEPFGLGMDAVADIKPLSVPVAGGVKVTLTYTLCPGARVYGDVSPLTA
jgi:hypothetical protein